MDTNSNNNQCACRQICCDVKNCVHHDGQSKCTANKITVGPSYAVSSGDTICSTFQTR